MDPFFKRCLNQTVIFFLKKRLQPTILEFAYANGVGKTGHKASLLEYSLIVIFSQRAF